MAHRLGNLFNQDARMVSPALNRFLSFLGNQGSEIPMTMWQKPQDQSQQMANHSNGSQNNYFSIYYSHVYSYAGLSLIPNNDNKNFHVHATVLS